MAGEVKNLALAAPTFRESFGSFVKIKLKSIIMSSAVARPPWGEEAEAQRG